MGTRAKHLASRARDFRDAELMRLDGVVAKPKCLHRVIFDQPFHDCIDPTELGGLPSKASDARVFAEAIAGDANDFCGAFLARFAIDLRDGGWGAWRLRGFLRGFLGREANGQGDE